MGKFAGFLKRMKKLDLGGKAMKGLSWLNDNVYKPLKPMIETGLDMGGYGYLKPFTDMGSKSIDLGRDRLKIDNSRGRDFASMFTDKFKDSQSLPRDITKRGQKYRSPFN